jgi:hypothetical protein
MSISIAILSLVLIFLPNASNATGLELIGVDSLGNRLI